MWIIYNLLGVLIYSVYLIYDTQLLAGGKRYQLSLDDYVVAALIVYLDIIMIFLYLLQLLGGKWLNFWFYWKFEKFKFQNLWDVINFFYNFQNSKILINFKF